MVLLFKYFEKTLRIMRIIYHKFELPIVILTTALSIFLISYIALFIFTGTLNVTGMKPIQNSNKDLEKVEIKKDKDVETPKVEDKKSNTSSQKVSEIKTIEVSLQKLASEIAQKFKSYINPGQILMYELSRKIISDNSFAPISQNKIRFSNPNFADFGFEFDSDVWEIDSRLEFPEEGGYYLGLKIILRNKRTNEELYIGFVRYLTYGWMGPAKCFAPGVKLDKLTDKLYRISTSDGNYIFTGKLLDVANFDFNSDSVVGVEIIFSDGNSKIYEEGDKFEFCNELGPTLITRGTVKEEYLTKMSNHYSGIVAGPNDKFGVFFGIGYGSEDVEFVRDVDGVLATLQY